MSVARTLLALVVTVLLAGLLAASSGASIQWHRREVSELRLSMSARPERIETCRERTEAELAARPAHMRQRLECVGRAATYDLGVTLDGVVVDRAVISGSGARGDRPIFLLRSYPVAEGERSVRVTFVRRETPDSNARVQSAIPPRLALDTVMPFRAGEAVLVAVEQGAFVVRRP